MKFQSYFVPSVEPFFAGTLIPSSSKAAGPASMTRIFEFGRPWLSRVDKASPAVPPPTMIYISKSDCVQSDVDEVHLNNAHIIVFSGRIPRSCIGASSIEAYSEQ